MLALNSTSSYNVANGNYALYSSTGTGNVALGFEAGSGLTSGDNNIIIGYRATPSGTGASNEVTLGNSSNNSYRMYAGSWTNVSDRRLKHDITDSPFGLEFVNKLVPRTFVYNNVTDGKKTVGFIAQEIAETLSSNPVYSEANTDLVTGFDETYLGVNYNYFFPILTKAIQELDKKVGMLSGSGNVYDTIIARIAALETKGTANAETTDALNALAEQIEGVKSQITTLDGSGATTASGVRSLDTKYTALNTEIAALKSELATLKSSQETTSTTSDATTRALNALADQIEMLKSHVGDFETTTSGSIASIKNTLSGGVISSGSVINAQFFDNIVSTISSLIVKVNTTFDEYIVFMKSVVFNDTVTFAQRVTFNDRDMAGRATISA